MHLRGKPKSLCFTRCFHPVFHIPSMCFLFASFVLTPAWAVYRTENAGLFGATEPPVMDERPHRHRGSTMIEVIGENRVIVMGFNCVTIVELLQASIRCNYYHLS